MFLWWLRVGVAFEALLFRKGIGALLSGSWVIGAALFWPYCWMRGIELAGIISEGAAGCFA